MVMAERISQEDQSSWTWPFSRSQLTAGLRRFLGDASLQVEGAASRVLTYRRPGIGRLRGLEVAYKGQAAEGTLPLVVKEPIGSTRTGLAGAGRREVGVYQSLAQQLPLRTPALICADPGGDWLVLEELKPALSADAWTPESHLNAARELAVLHERFWDLGEDLEAFPWLGRPLAGDFEVHVTAAAMAIQRIVELSTAEVPALDRERMRLLARLMEGAEKVAGPLRDLPCTLLHGDYWPGNIHVLEDGSQAVYDWQMASVGPAMLDLLVFVKKSQWWFGSLPLEVDDLFNAYRQEIKARMGLAWADEQWLEQWDHALVWRFLQEWLDVIAVSPDALLKTRAVQLDEVWLEPVTSAMLRRLKTD
jgi:aminoglycoside phosphotransferase (APT) family kinase protein